MENVYSRVNFAFIIVITALFSPSKILVNVVCVIPDLVLLALGELPEFP